MTVRSLSSELLMVGAACLAFSVVNSAAGQAPPVVNTIFPPGVQAGRTAEVTVGGSNLQGLQKLHGNVPGIQCERLDASRFRLTIPEGTQPGLYDLWGVGDNGISAPRTFAISNRTESLESEPNEAVTDAATVPLDGVINGRIEKAGDIDYYRFTARQGQRVSVECSAERIDSRLRGVLEIFDAAGRRLAVNRGYFGIDPLIDFGVPADGSYFVKLQDLTSSGSAEHYYRLEIDTGPRVAFTVPSVIERGKASRVAVYGWNLRQASKSVETSAERGSHGDAEFDRVEVDIPPALARESWPLPVPLQPAQAVIADAAFPFYLPGSRTPVLIGVTDVPVVMDNAENHSPSSAQVIDIPCEVSGQLVAGDERDWFAIEARRGEVLHFEALGQRLGSPVDLQLSVLDASGERELARFGDEVRNSGGAFPSSHLDPAGRWVCPADGRYLVMVRNLVGGLETDPRRIYRLSMRREEPDFVIVALPPGDAPAALNVQRGGRAALDLLAFRRRGMDGAIRVFARDLPAGLECPELWLGPGVNQTTIVVSADRETPTFGELKFEAISAGNLGTEGQSSPIAALDNPSARPIALSSTSEQRHPVFGGTVVRVGTPIGWGRITSQIPLAITGDAPLRLEADAHESLEHHIYGKLQVRHSPGGFVDVAVHVERRGTEHQSPIRLMGVGLPESIESQVAVVPAEGQQGYLSFYLPPTLPVGRYSFVIRGETSVSTSNNKTQPLVIYSNPVTIDVQPAAFRVEVDPFTEKRVKRGDIIKVAYSSKRLNGFIGKMHTELAVPGRITDIEGLRGRGETFTNQTEKGSLQIIINEDAPLGPQSNLRLFTVGVLDDRPLFFGSSALPLEIVE
jgi:hypothetical protein